MNFVDWQRKGLRKRISQTKKEYEKQNKIKKRGKEMKIIKTKKIKNSCWQNVSIPTILWVSSTDFVYQTNWLVLKKNGYDF